MRLPTTLSISMLLVAGNLTGAMAQTTIVPTIDTVSDSSIVEGSINSAKSGYVATSTPASGKTGSGTVFYTNDSNIYVTNNSGTSPFYAYGVLDFQGGLSATNMTSAPTYASTVTAVTSPILNITEYSNTHSTLNDVTDVYLVTDDVSSDYYDSTGKNNSTLTYQTAPASGPVGVGSQLGTAYLLGTDSTYTNGKSVNDAVALTGLTTNSAATNLFLSELNKGQDIRIVLAEDPTQPAASGVTSEAAFDGSYYANLASNPSPLNLTFNAVEGSATASPEPSQWGLLAFMSVGLSGLILKARKRTAAQIA